jgi:Mn2+/Fe2+ NRAMP family transporter
MPQAEHFDGGPASRSNRKKGGPFCGTIALATIVGMALNFMPIDSIKALYYSAVINGVAAFPVPAAMMVLCRDESVMGRFRVTGWLFGLGWTTTAVMGSRRSLFSD